MSTRGAALPDFEATAWSWVAHLRGGGTTPWAQWRREGAEHPGRRANADAVAPYGVPLPGAAQLELVRLLAERWSPGPGFAHLADTVFAVSGPGRGLPELPLTGAPVAPSSGPRPVDPVDVPRSELVRVATGVIVSLVLGIDPDTWSGGDSGRRRPWRKSVKVAGPPLTVDALRKQLRRDGCDDAGNLEGAVVVALPVDLMVAEVWGQRVLEGADLRWGRFWAKWHRDDELPVFADVAALCDRWCERLGGDRVTVVVAPSPQRAAQLVSQALTCDVDPAAISLPLHSTGAVEVLRGVNTALGVATDDEGRRRAGRVLRHLLLEGDGHAHAAVPAPPAQLHDWATEMAREAMARIAESGCTVVGDLEDHLPRDPATLGEAPDEGDVLDAALAACARAARPAVQP